MEVIIQIIVTGVSLNLTSQNSCQVSIWSSTIHEIVRQKQFEGLVRRSMVEHEMNKTLTVSLILTSIKRQKRQVSTIDLKYPYNVFHFQAKG